MENIYHRYINLPFELEKPERIKDFFPEHMRHERIDDHVDENMNAFVESLGLRVLLTELFYTPPNGGKIPPHTDLSEFDNRVKINQTWGPDGGRMLWWKIKDEGMLFGNDNEAYKVAGFSDEKHNNILAQESDCDLVYEADTNPTSLVNVGQLHSTFNPGDYGRWTLCFHIWKGDKFVDWHEAQEIFKDYLV